MLQKYQHLFFDFDGTLCDSAAVAIEEYERIRSEQFAELPRIPTEATFDDVYAGPLKTSLNKWLSQEQTNQFFNLHSRAMEKRTCDVNLFPLIDRLLRELPETSASIVTSAYSAAVQEILERSGIRLAPAIYRILGREMGLPKDSKIKHVLAELNINPAHALYIGDLESDLLYCNKIPMDMIAVGYGYQSPSYASAIGAQHFVEGVGDLIDLLSTFGGPRLRVITLHEFD